MMKGIRKKYHKFSGLLLEKQHNGWNYVVTIKGEPKEVEDKKVEMYLENLNDLYEILDLKEFTSVVLYPESLKIHNNALVEEDIRVKYLDEEDIEDLGFSEKYNNYFIKQAPGNIGYFTEIALDFRFGYDKITIKGLRGSEEEFFFQGKVKNKSELKKLMEMLEIVDA